MACKYVINNNEIIMGDVEFHIDLIDESKKNFKTIGGGRWHLDSDGKQCYFFGISTDFGGVKKEQFIEAVENSQLPIPDECEIFFSNRLSMADATKEGWIKI